jgi:hypothetical protein
MNRFGRRRSLWSLLSAICVFAGLCGSALVSPRSASAATIAIDGFGKTHQSTPSSTIVSGPFSTTSSNDLLVAFITSDGPDMAGGQAFSSVSGAGLNWMLRERTNSQPGTAEIWEALAPNPLTNVKVTATRKSGSYVGSIVVIAFSGASTTINGAVASGSGKTGMPTATLTTTEAGSWVWGVGDDWDNAISRTVGSNQTEFDEYLAPVGDTYWVQRQSSVGNAANSQVTIDDTAPTTDHFDLSLVEIVPAVADTAPPTTPTNVAAHVVSSSQVNLTWAASTDDVAVAGYYVFRNGSQITTTSDTSYSDTGLSPSTTYSYTVQAFDVGHNVSAQSSPPATVTTQPASTNPPVISNVQVTSVTQTSAVISWATDIPSSSQVNYGTSSSYTSSTTLDPTLETSHSTTLTALSAGTIYHFEVVSTGSANNTSTSSDATFTTLATNITPPDLQIKVPSNLISIGSGNGGRQLQFTHITWDAGTGPFEIDPTYNSQTGIASFQQAIYNSPSPGVWNHAYSVPVVAPGIFDSPFDYRFPLTRFTLNQVNADGSLGGVVATSPKTDYCITADAYVGGVPNTPNSSYIPQNNCTNPNLPLGWSVGWGDQYDQTDSGQPISLAGVANGTYILHATVDPEHVLTESNNANNVTDTKIQISKRSVTVLSQTNPVTNPPSAAITSPIQGANVSGTVTIEAAAAATSPATVTSVQFLLDGQPLGGPVTSAPYSYNWTLGSTSSGTHQLSAQVTDSSGNVGTAQPISVNVVPSGPSTVSTSPSINITNPVDNQIESGTVPVVADATDNTAVKSVQYFLDGSPLGSLLTTSPYSIRWNTSSARNGTHTLTAQATDTAGLVGTSAAVTVTVQNPAPPMTCFVLQAQVTVHGAGTVTTPAFHTAARGEVLIAFVSADSPAATASQSATVTGSGLTWTLVKRANAQPGDAEVWAAHAPRVLNSATITSKLARTSFRQDLTVIAMEGVRGVGASAANSASNGSPGVNLTTTDSTSLVFAVGHDWDNAVGRALPTGWVSLEQWLDKSSHDTYWSQYTNTPTGPAHSIVHAGDTRPTTDQYNIVAVELLNDD